MIVNNSSLGFTDTAGDCRSNTFCQIVSKEDNQVWQVSAVCDELTGGGEAQSCESNIILYPYTDQFLISGGIDGQVIIADTYIKLTEADSSVVDQIFTPNLTLEPNKCYFLRYSVTGYTSGSIRTTANNIVRAANGTYFEVYCTDAAGILSFEYGDGNPELPTNLTLSNIFIGCIRYGVIYDVTTGVGDEDKWAFVSQTAIEKTEASSEPIVISLNDTTQYEFGLTYRVCLTISQAIGGDVTVEFGSDTEVYAANGRFCQDIVLATDKDFTITLSDAFIGIVSDITIELVPEINAELFDCDGNIVVGGITVLQTGSYAKLTMGDVAEGCYSIGVADSCTNYKHQFYGNVLDVETITSDTINTSTGAWTAEPNEAGNEERILFSDAVCCGKTYDATITVSYSGGEDVPVVDYFSVTIILGGTQYTQTITPPLTLANPYEFSFSNIEAGCENEDLEIVFSYSFTGAAFFFGTMGLPGSDPEIAKSTVTMDPGQICPEKYSRCIKVVESVSSCGEPTVLIKYRNDNNAFGFDYTSDGFTHADGFYNMMRIAAKIWKPSYPKTKEIQKNSSGRRTLYFSDVDKKYIMNTGLLPEEIHDALSIALEHNTLLIDDVEYVCASEEYEPEWTKNSATAPVEVELFTQRTRMVNTKC